MTAAAASGQRYRRDIEGLRAVAVLGVVSAHLTGWPSGGFVGVDVFFVISGFLICGLLVREQESRGSISLRGFYARRIRRLLPAAALVLFATVIGAILLLPLSRAIQTAIDAGWSALVVANWHFAAVGTDYFQQGQPPSPLQHFWTLSVEEQFYLAWPLLLVVVGSFLASRGARGSLRRIAGSIAAIVVVVSLVWAIAQSATDPTVAYFSTLTRAWELAAGALLACLVPVIPSMTTTVRTVIAHVGLFGIVLSMLFITPEALFPGPGAVAPVVATCMVIIAGVGAEPRVAVLTNPVSRLFGAISYSLYLWHWPAIVLLAAVLPAGPLTSTVALLASIAAAALTYYFIENPVRRSRWLESWTVPGRRSRTIFGVVLAGGGGAVLVLTLGVTGLAERQDSSALPTMPVDFGNCSGAAVVLSGQSCEPISDSSRLRPSIDRAADDTRGAYSCWRPEGGDLRVCSYGAADPGLRVALVGDSHAAMLLPALVSEAEARGWSVDSYVGYGCQWTANGRGDCVDQREEIQQRLLGQAYDVVLTTASRSVGGADIDDSATGYALAWQPVIDAGSMVVVVADNPSVEQSALACLTRVGATASDVLSCGTSRGTALATPDPLLAASALVPETRVIDFTDVYCTDSFCPAVLGDVIVYRDTAGHITGTFSLTLARYLADWIESQTAFAPPPR